jgi:hypothetical protein
VSIANLGVCHLTKRWTSSQTLEGLRRHGAHEQSSRGTN